MDYPTLEIIAPTPWSKDLTIHLNGEPLRGVTRISFDVAAGKSMEPPTPMTVRLELLASVDFRGAVRILADAGAEFVTAQAQPATERPPVEVTATNTAGESSADQYYRQRLERIRADELPAVCDEHGKPSCWACKFNVGDDFVPPLT